MKADAFLSLMLNNQPSLPMFKEGDRVKFLGIDGDPTRPYDHKIFAGDLGTVVGVDHRYRVDKWPIKVLFDRQETWWRVALNEIEVVTNEN